MSATRMVQKRSMKLKTSLCYNPDLERLTLTIYNLKGLEVCCPTFMNWMIDHFMQIYDGEDFPDTYVKISVTQHMRIVKTKKTSLVRRTLEPSFNQSFDIKLGEKFLGVTFLTVQLKQSRLFAVKGNPTYMVFNLISNLFYCIRISC